jgi:hypothetical protein
MNRTDSNNLRCENSSALTAERMLYSFSFNPSSGFYFAAFMRSVHSPGYRQRPAIGARKAFFTGNSLCSPPNPFYYLLPSYSPFNLFLAILQGSILKGTDVILLTLYAFDFIILMLLVALWLFQKKEVC